MSTTTRRKGKQAEPRPVLRFSGISNDVDLLMPETASRVPVAVRQASQEAEAAHQRWQSARAPYFAAEAEAKRAPRIDAAADQAAVAAGQPLPSERVVTQAQQALEQTERARSAARAGYVGAQRHLATEVSVALPTWLPAQQEAVTAAQQQVAQALTTLAASFDQLQTEQAILVALASWPEQGGNLSGIRFGCSERDHQHAEAKRAQVAEQVRLSVNGGGSMRNYVVRDLDHLIAALALLADEGGVPQQRQTTTALAS